MRFSKQECQQLAHNGFSFPTNTNGLPKRDGRLLITSHLVRGQHATEPPTVFAQGGGDDALHAVVDAVHWQVNDPALTEAQRVRVALRRSGPNAVPNATVAALQVLANHASIDLVGFELRPNGSVQWSPCATMPATATDPRVARWCGYLRSRSSQPLPVEALAVLNTLGNRVPAFRWYRSVTGTELSGRVAGWQVCTLASRRRTLRWRPVSAIAAVPIRSTADLCRRIETFATERANRADFYGRRKLEHLFEAAALRGRLNLQLTPSWPALVPLVKQNQLPFQFPALYAHGGGARYIDALMRDNDALWVVELKVNSSGEGQAYRHALTQAVLYREFIRHAVGLHPWFTGQGVDPQSCLAAIAFPRIGSAKSSVILADLKRTALRFGVRVIELDMDIDQIRQRAMT